MSDIAKPKPAAPLMSSSTSVVSIPAPTAAASSAPVPPTIAAKGDIAMPDTAAQVNANPRQSGEGSLKPRITPDSTATEITKQVQEESDKQIAEKKTQKTDQDIATERQVRLTEIIETGEYTVSVGASKASTNVTTFITTALAIVLVGAFLMFLAADLDLIDIGIELPFQLFKQ